MIDGFSLCPRATGSSPSLPLDCWFSGPLACSAALTFRWKACLVTAAVVESLLLLVFFSKLLFLTRRRPLPPLSSSSRHDNFTEGASGKKGHQAGRKSVCKQRTAKRKLKGVLSLSFNIKFVGQHFGITGIILPTRPRPPHPSQSLVNLCVCLNF